MRKADGSRRGSAVSLARSTLSARTTKTFGRAPPSADGSAADSDPAEATTKADELRALHVQLRSDERVAKLNTLVDEFQGFNEGLHADETEQRAHDEARTQTIERALERLQGMVAAEVETRMGVVEDVRLSLDAQVEALDVSQAARLVDAREAAEVDVGLLANRLEGANVTFDEDRVATQRAIERAHKQLLRTLQGLRDALGVEIVMRIEREAQAAKRVSDEAFALQELLQGEAGAFQATLGHMRDEHEHAAGLLASSDERFKHAVMQQLTACQKALRAEMEERLAVEQQLVGSLQDYAAGLMDGLANVNRRVRDDGQIR